MSERDALGLRIDGGGLCLTALGLWLDPPSPRPVAFVSHAHAARALGAAAGIATPETLAIATALGAPAEQARALAWDGALELPITPELGGGSARLSVAPAGHMLGAAQLVVDHPRGRLVYTGDWGREGDATHPGGAVVECDELILGTTFALPIFRFDPLARGVASVVDWCAARLAEQTTPIVLAQTPGPAQSLVAALLARGVPVAGHAEVLRACTAYRAMGVPLGEVSEHVSGARGAAVVAPASARATSLRGRGKTAVAYASGWALLDAAVEQRRADAAFAVADVADHDALVELVRASGARRVVTTCGDARAFAHLLCGRGVEAEALELSPIDERGAS